LQILPNITKYYQIFKLSKFLFFSIFSKNYPQEKKAQKLIKVRRKSGPDFLTNTNLYLSDISLKLLTHGALGTSSIKSNKLSQVLLVNSQHSSSCFFRLSPCNGNKICDFAGSSVAFPLFREGPLSLVFSDSLSLYNFLNSCDIPVINE
jgi:hypothetical protein